MRLQFPLPLDPKIVLDGSNYLGSCGYFVGGEVIWFRLHVCRLEPRVATAHRLLISGHHTFTIVRIGV